MRGKYEDLTLWVPAATMNAFVLPGGKVFVYSGILPVCRNDSGLAAVLGEYRIIAVHVCLCSTTEH